MSEHQKVIWSQGAFLHPEQFQQYDRHLEYRFSRSQDHIAPYHWGITRLEINEDFLKLGKIALNQCRGTLPDGTVFDLPHHDTAPLPLDVPEGTSNTLVYLAVPLQRPGTPHASRDEQSSTRYHIETIDIRDNTEGSHRSTSVETGKLALKLLLEKDFKEGYTGIAIARIQEARGQQEIVLDTQFLPTCLDAHAVPALHELVSEIHGLLHYRGDKLVERLNSSAGGVADISNFLLLQLINREESKLERLTKRQGLHPECLYGVLADLAAELTTFTDLTRRTMTGLEYRHDNLLGTFDPIRQKLRQELSLVLEENAISIPLEERQNSIWVGLISDKHLLQNAQFILAVHASISPDSLRQAFLSQVKAAPVEEIRNLVNRALPGIPLQVLTVPPRQIPFHSDYVYFSLNRQDPLWQQVAQSTGLALHIGGLFPGLKMEFWAIKG
jgi:type VI secretion system protein ImpJ